MARGKITDKWSAYFMYSFANTGKILEAYTEYRFLPQLTARIGQFKTMYTIENPMSPCFVELINCYSQAVNYLAGINGTLSTGERIFLMRLRVKKYREVRADGGEALFKHFLGRGAHDDPVTVSACGHVMARLTKKHVTHVSADGINLHKLKLVRSENPDQGRSASLAVGSEGVTVPTNDLKEPRSSFSR